MDDLDSEASTPAIPSQVFYHEAYPQRSYEWTQNRKLQQQFQKS